MSNAASDDERDEETADNAAEDSLGELAAYLWRAVKAVTPAEFTWQEAHYDHDSRLGRELLFLMANYEWVRATSEIVDITRSDTIETTIKIDVDLSQVTHEAFRKRTGPIWLPVAVLPPYIRRDDPTLPAEADTGPREPDLFATVTDAAGKPVPMMPAAELQHQISAAMAEIIAKMAVSYIGRPAPGASENGRSPPAISGCCCRPLSTGCCGRVPTRRAHQDRAASAAPSTPPADRGQGRSWSRSSAISTAADIAGRRPGGADAAATDDALPAELARRAVKVLLALRESLIVVVLMDYIPRAVGAVGARAAAQAHGLVGFAAQAPDVDHPAGRRLEIAVLLATADADRQIQVNLPDGVSVDRRGEQRPGRPRDGPWLDMAVHTPLPLQDLSAALDQVADGAATTCRNGRWLADWCGRSWTWSG